MAEEQDGETTFSLPNISCACGATPTEQILNAGGGPQMSGKANQSPRNEIGQKIKTKKGRHRIWGWGSVLWRESWRRSFHTIGTPLTSRVSAKLRKLRGKHNRENSPQRSCRMAVTSGNRLICWGLPPVSGSWVCWLGLCHGSSGKGPGLNAGTFWGSYTTQHRQNGENHGITRETTEHSCRKVLTPHSEPRHAHRTKNHDLANINEGQAGCHLWPQRQRSRHATARDGRQAATAVPAPETASAPKIWVDGPQSHPRLPGIMDSPALPGESQPESSYPGETHAHLGLCLHSSPGARAAWPCNHVWSSHWGHPTHASGTCNVPLSPQHSWASEPKWEATLSPLVSGQRSDTEEKLGSRGGPGEQSNEGGASLEVAGATE